MSMFLHDVDNNAKAIAIPQVSSKNSQPNVESDLGIILTNISPVIDPYPSKFKL